MSAGASIDIEQLDLWFDSLQIGFFNNIPGIGVSKSWELWEGGHGTAGLMNFIPFAVISQDLAQWSWGDEQSYFKDLPSDARVTVSAAASIFDVGGGVSFMAHEKNPAIERQSAAFGGVMEQIAINLADDERDNFEGVSVSDEDKDGFKEIIELMKRVAHDIGVDSSGSQEEKEALYKRIGLAITAWYKANLTEENEGLRLSGVNIGVGFGVGLASILATGGIGTVALIVAGALNIEQTDAIYQRMQSTRHQEIEAGLTTKPFEMRAHNYVEIGGTQAYYFPFDEIGAIDRAPASTGVQIYEGKDGYYITGAEEEQLFVATMYDGEYRRSVLYIERARTDGRGAFVYDRSDHQGIPDSWDESDRKIVTAPTLSETQAMQTLETKEILDNDDYRTIRSALREHIDRGGRDGDLQDLIVAQANNPSKLGNAWDRFMQLVNGRR